MTNSLDKALRLVAVWALVAAAVVPLYVSTSLFFPFISGKNFAFRILIEIAFAAWMLLALRDSSYRPRRSWVLWSVLFFLATLGISTLLAEDPYKSFWSNFERMEGFIGVVHFALYFFVAGAVLRARDWRRLVGISLGVNTLVIGYALLQFFGVLVINQGGVRVDATFGNAIYLGVYALFHLFFALCALQWVRQEGKHRALVFLCAALACGNVVLVVLSATRGAILGLFVGVVAYSLYLAFSRGASWAVRRAGIIGCVVALLAVGAFFSARAVPQLRNHPIVGRILSASPVSDDAQARFIIWGISWKGFLERPLFGWGQEGFNFVFNKFYDPRLYGREQWFDRAHNAYLDWLIAGGVFGLLGYLALWFCAARIVCRMKKKGGEPLFTMRERALLVGFGAAYAVNNIFVFDNGVSYALFFMLLAYVHFRATEDTPPFFGSVPIAHGIFVRLYAPFIVVALAFSVYWFNARPIYAGTLLLEALRPQPKGPADNLAIFKRALALNTFVNAEIREQLAQAAVVAPIARVPTAVKQEFVALAASELDKEIKTRPTDARYYTFMATLLESFRLYNQAFPYWEKASALSPGKQLLLFQMGGNRLNAGQTKEALPYFKKAYDMNPDNRDAVLLYVVGFIFTGERAGETQALSVLEKVSSASLVDPRLIAAYAANGRTSEAIRILQVATTRHPENAAAYAKKIQELRNQK